MFYTNKRLAQNPRLQHHWKALWANRNGKGENGILVPNFDLGFWREVDAAVVAARDEADGMEILADLAPVTRTLPVGKTVAGYVMASDIGDDVKVSVDGQLPYTFDQVDHVGAGDPVPMFTAGYGVNWRLAAGKSTIGIDAVLDSQQAKMIVYNEKLVKYLLNGDATIKVDGHVGQGLMNHANTKKAVDGSSHLSTGTQLQLDTLFTSGAIGTARAAEKVRMYDVAWVGPGAWLNLQGAYVLNGVVTDRTIGDTLKAKWGIGEFRLSYALGDNEMLAYVRRSDALSIAEGMPTSVVALPRPTPTTNYNFQIMGAMGVQVKLRGGLKRVLYVATT